MNESPIDAIKRTILAEALKHYDKQMPAEWTKEELGDDWHVYKTTAEQLKENGYVDLSGSGFTSLKVRLTSAGETYCKDNGIS